MDETADGQAASGSFRNLQTNIGIKISKYKNLGLEFFIVICGDFDQIEINNWIARKATLVPSNCKVLTTLSFMQEISQYKPHVISSY